MGVATLLHEATRKKQAGVGEVAEVSQRAGAERAECGGVLPGAGVVRAALFRMEKTVARGGAGGRLGAKFVEVQGVPSGWGQAGATREPSAASVSRAAGDARVEVLLKNGRSLWVGPGFDAELVRALVAVVESAA